MNGPYASFLLVARPLSRDFAALHTESHISPPLNSEFNHGSWCGPREDIHDSERGLKKHLCAFVCTFVHCHRQENMPRLASPLNNERPVEKSSVAPVKASLEWPRASRPQHMSPAEPRTAAQMSPGEQPNLNSQFADS